MENATKALIMAGGILLTVLLVSLLVYAWSLYSDYQSSKDSLIEIQDTAKFNSQFTGYDRDDVQGYELLSLINQVIDYNERRTNDTVNGGNDKYPPIEITVTLGDESKRKGFTHNNKILLFEQEKYTENELTAVSSERVRASFKKNIENTISEIRGNLNLDDNTLTSMAKNIRTIFKTESEIEQSARSPQGEKEKEEVKRMMISTFNSYIKKYPLENKEEDYEKLILETDARGETNPINKNTIVVNGEKINVYRVLCAYYEYMQFKRGIFKCTKLTYDTNNTGRVIKIDFEYTGKIK